MRDDARGAGGYGASLRAALSAGAAVDALSEFTPDLVLTDIAMPAQDGYAVFSEVRALEAHSGIACRSRR